MSAVNGVRRWMYCNRHQALYTPTAVDHMDSSSFETSIDWGIVDMPNYSVDCIASMCWRTSASTIDFASNIERPSMMADAYSMVLM